MNGALAGIRVLDFGRILAAPIAGQLLADLGAEVIKIERPGRGDDARGFGATTDESGRPMLSAMHLCANRNKKSLTLDLSQARGRELARRLASDADVVIENFLPGAMARFGLDYATLALQNPRLVYCSVTGFGQDGPYRDRPGYDGVFQALGGLMSITGLPAGDPGGVPMKTGPSMIDSSTGLVAATAILAALVHRAQSGRGQYVEATLLDTVLAMQSSVVQGYLLTGRQPPRRGTEGNGGHPARDFACRDGPIYISAGHDHHYAGLCQVLGRPELIDDPRFITGALRYRNRAEWNRLAEPLIRQWLRADLVAALVAARVPACELNEYADVFADPQVRHREVEQRIPDPMRTGETIGLVSSPLRLHGTPVRQDRPPPLLGEHSRDLLRDLLGLADDDIDALARDGVI